MVGGAMAGESFLEQDCQSLGPLLHPQACRELVQVVTHSCLRGRPGQLRLFLG